MTHHKVILDLDPGIDDSLALILAVMATPIEILGVSIVSGNVDCDQGARNATYVLDFLNQHQIPIIKGADRPLVIAYQDARDTHGQDGLSNQIFASEDRSCDQDVLSFYRSAVDHSPQSISLLALGPLTNLAQVAQADPGLLSRFKEIRIMGGVHTVQGNCSPVGEYNFWCDPHAAQLFFDQADLPPTCLYTLDVTYSILMTPNLREYIHQLRRPLAQFVWTITQFYVDFHWQAERTLSCVINDPLVVADLLEPMVTFKPAHVTIQTQGDCRGQSCVTYQPQGPIQVSQTVDSRHFFTHFLQTLFQLDPEVIAHDLDYYQLLK